MTLATAATPLPAESAPDDLAALSTKERDRLVWLRGIAIASRAAPRIDEEWACTIARRTPEAQARALLRLLPQALGRKVVFHRPCARSVTFDEHWLLGLLRSASDESCDNLTFALASRMHRRFLRPAKFLAEALARGGSDLEYV